MGKSQYQKQSIREMIQLIDKREVLLPALQRKFVWKEQQITELLDSIMRDYPFGTFLFWNASNEKLVEDKYTLYEFIRDYHERDRILNDKANLPSNSRPETLIALDGQQRLTALYISLMGSMTKKKKGAHWSNDNAFIKKEVYFDVRSNSSIEESDETSSKYKFQFLSSEQFQQLDEDEKKYWFKLKRIVSAEFGNISQVDSFIDDNNFSDRGVRENLRALFRIFNESEIISYYQVDTDSMDEVLDIFVRINSGGTILSKSDLIFSTIVSHWDEARDRMDKLTQEINKIGDGFSINNDFLMLSCIYIEGFDVALKVDNFLKDNVKSIQNRFEYTAAVLRAGFRLLDDFGFSGGMIQSYRAVHPIIYYLHMIGTEGKPEEFPEMERYQKRLNEVDSQTREVLKKYFILSQIKNVFAFASNNTLTALRKILKEDMGGLEYESLKKMKLTSTLSFVFDEEDIQELLETKKGSKTFFTLSLLYTDLQYSKRAFHQDHLHPDAGFSQKKLEKMGLDKDKIASWRSRKDCLPNLQILEGRENSSKSKMELKRWIEEHPNKNLIKYIPQNTSYEFSEFEQFYCEREKILKNEISKVLDISCRD